MRPDLLSQHDYSNIEVIVNDPMDHKPNVMTVDEFMELRERFKERMEQQAFDDYRQDLIDFLRYRAALLGVPE